MQILLIRDEHCVLLSQRILFVLLIVTSDFYGFLDLESGINL